MKLHKHSMIAATFLCCAMAASARGIRDHRTYPDEYYLTIDQVADSYRLLPAPPADSSARWLYDVERYNWGKTLRDTERGLQAMDDAHIDAKGLAAAFSEAFGMPISQENTPQIIKLIGNMREDSGDLSTRSAKETYQRKRPFVYFDEATCLPDEQKWLSSNGSYPSGHTATGWAVALVLAEINPERQNEILKRGFELGESRVICGYHFQSDVDAARVVGSAVVARLHADKEFARQLKKAKKEFKKKKKEFNR